MTMTGGLKQATGLVGQKSGVKKLSAAEMRLIGAEVAENHRRRWNATGAWRRHPDANL